MSENPYQPPKARVDDEAASVDGLPYATKGRRFANMLLDTIFYDVCPIVLGLVLGVLGLGQAVTQMNGLEQLLLGWSLFTAYYLVQEGLWGVTLGKLITGTRVIGEGGPAPAFRQILGRTLARLVPFEPFSFLGSRPTGWHDRWSGTKVVLVRGSR